MITKLSFPDSRNSNVIEEPSADHIEAAVYSIPIDQTMSKVRLETKKMTMETRHIKDGLYHCEYLVEARKYVMTKYISAEEIILLMQRCARREEIEGDYEWRSYDVRMPDIGAFSGF